MKSNTFNYSLLAIGVAAVLGMSTAASAVETPLTTTGVDISNQATASYSVAGQAQPEAKSNIVKVSVSQQVRFSLTADNDDTAAPTGGTQFDNKNENITVAPNGFVLFNHTLKNTGNTTDTYDITLGDTDAKYIQNESTVTFIVYAADGTTIVRQDTVIYTANATISSILEKGQSVKFTIRAKTSGNQGNETLPLELSVTSRNLTGVAGATKTLTNTDTSFTRLPTFSIVKTIRNGLDLNNANDTAQYQIVVTNQSTAFSADATEVNIADFLPAGLVLAVPLTATNITASSTATVGTIVANNAGDSGFNVTGNTIPVGQSITFLFTVKKGGSGTLDPATAINHVTVTDDLDNDPLTLNTLVDSTDTGKEQNVGEFYPTRDTNYTDGVERTLATGDDSTGPLSSGGTIQRALTLTGPTVREIAPVTGLTSTATAGQVTHATVITNTGKDVEGSKPGELTFTITDNDGTTPDAINIVPGTVKVTYDPNDGTGAGTAQVIAAGTDGIYDINTVLTAGIKAGGIVTITYNVSANNAPMFNSSTTTDDANATFENTIVTLIPGAEGAPTRITVTDKTTVRGLVLVKKQAIDANCNAIPAAGNFTIDDIEGALPGQCIVYQIQARNTFTTAGLASNITDITILDKFGQFSANATYVPASLTTTKGAPTITANDVSAVSFTLAAQETATMQFKVKIKPGITGP